MDYSHGWNEHKSRSRSRRVFRRTKGKYLVCGSCGSWAWESRWQPKCWCGCEWGSSSTPAIEKEITTSKDELKRKLVVELGGLLGVDLSQMLAVHLPAPAPPKRQSDEQIEDALWKAMGKARAAADKVLAQKKKVDKQIAEKEAALEEAKDKQFDLQRQLAEAETFAEECKTSYFRGYSADAQKR